MMDGANMKILLPNSDKQIMFVPKVWSRSKFVGEKIVEDLSLFSLAF